MKITVRPWKGDTTGHEWEYDIEIPLPDRPRIRERRKSPLTSYTATVRFAQARAQELLADAMRPPEPEAAPEPKPAPTLEEFAPRWVTDYAIVKKRQKASEIESKRSIIRTHLIPWRGPVALDQLGPRDGLDLERSLADRSRKTFNNVAAVVNSMFRWAVTWGEIRQVPFVLQGVKLTRKEHEFYDFEEYDLLLGACPHADPRAELILLMGADEGMRMGEMRELRRTDVMIASRRLTIARRVWKKSDVDVPKGGLVCQLSMTERMADAFRRNRHLKGDLVLSYPDGTRLSEETTRSLFRRLCRLAGVPDKGIQALRHTFCSHLAMLGRYPIEIQKAARHQHIETTMGYMHLSPRRQESAIDVLNRRNWREMGDGPREGAGEIAK